MPKPIGDIMGGNERVILYCQDLVFITWNRSLTLQAWRPSLANYGLYEDFACRTLEEKPDSIEAAIQAAEKFYIQA